MLKHNRPTCFDLTALKGKRPLVQVMVRSAEEAAAAAAAGVDMISCDEDQWTPEFRAAAPSTLMITSLTYGAHVNADDCIRAGFKAMRGGADAVYTATSTANIVRMFAEGIPVIGHVGLIPTRATWTGGFRAVGKTAESAAQVWRHCLELQDAGVFAIEMEVVPGRVAHEISRRLRVLTFGMGTGTGCDSRYLFADDILGLHDTHYPRYAKRYRDFATLYKQLQQERIAAFTEYKRDVETGAYPGVEHVVPIKDDEFDAFVRALGDAPSA
jgi:3-methyl-2-oxobutanoate hydroxymethyltransferase